MFKLPMFSLVLVPILGSYLAIAAAVRAAAQDISPVVTHAPALLDTIELREFLVLPAVGHYGRLPIHQDAVEAQIVSGKWRPPVEGEQVGSEKRDQKFWRAVAVDKSGTLDTRAFRGGYAFAKFDSANERVMLLKATGHASVNVNGQWRTGDPYGTGWLELPVLVRQGQNTLLFQLAGEQLSASLSAPEHEVSLMKRDAIVPTLVRGEIDAEWGAVNVINASQAWRKDAQLFCSVEQGGKSSTALPAIPPLSVQKVAFQIPPAGRDQPDTAGCQLELLAGPEKTILSSLTLQVKRVGLEEPQLRTFRSRIDGSVQPYAVRPAVKPMAAEFPFDEPPLPGIIVTLHDAGIDCEAHLGLLSAQSSAHIVAPQGRRPYGFDWEDWARFDAMEALEDSRRRYPHDPGRIFLTGHGMGGHGAWHLGVTYPDQFTAIGPSSGWASFWSYGGGMPSFQNPNPLESLLLRSYSPSDTVKSLTNLADLGVYVLHRSADDTVPVEQSRFMRKRLGEFHTNFAYYENPEINLWPVDHGCDWPPMGEFFERLARPSASQRTAIDFITADPGISNSCDWLSIEVQQAALKPSRAIVRQDVDTRTFVGQTTNVARLSIDVEHLPPWQPIDVTLDGQQMAFLPWPDDYRLWFERTGKEWNPVDPPARSQKSPQRSGRFKAAFDHGAMLVYGTVGNEEENRWAEAKARYDAETFWYRGGGALTVIPDQQFDARESLGRSVILYGNSDTNSAWPALLAHSPVQVRRGAVQIGDRTESGDDLALLMVYPRGDDEAALIGVVAGTGPSGNAMTNRLRYFVAGIGYPDLMLLNTAGLETSSAGIRAWGFFGPDWSIDSGEIAWRGDE